MEPESIADPAPDSAPAPDPGAKVLAAALALVPFDGWSMVTLRAAIEASGVAPALAHALFPRGGVDLALAYHRACDREMTERLTQATLSAMRFSDRVAFAVRTRLDTVGDRELVRRASALFALPQHAADGARAIWSTSDAIWRALGDTSVDFNFYSKRVTLSAVYTASVLYWLGDDSPEQTDTQAFIARRIADVMRIEKLKSAIRDNTVAQALRRGPIGSAMAAIGRMRPKMPDMPSDLPGRTRS